MATAATAATAAGAARAARASMGDFMAEARRDVPLVD